MKGQLWKTELKQRRKRKQKIKKLREKYILSKTLKEKKQILEKALRVNPFLTEEEFLKFCKK